MFFEVRFCDTVTVGLMSYPGSRVFYIYLYGVRIEEYVHVVFRDRLQAFIITPPAGPSAFMKRT